MDVSALTIQDLERILDDFPWFTVARKEYVRRHRDLGAEALNDAASAAGIFFLSRKEMLGSLADRVPSGASDSSVEGGNPRPTGGSPVYYVVGGDYFGKEDFSELERSGNAFDVSALRYNPIESTLGALDFKSPSGSVAGQIRIDPPCTETLARIYSDQQLYDKAIEVYEKLILLYPEKNTYFASLIEEAKNSKQ